MGVIVSWARWYTMDYDRPMQMQPQRRRESESDDAVEVLLYDAILDRAARMKKCLDALRAHGVPLDADTAECLMELGTRMGLLIQEALATQEAAQG